MPSAVADPATRHRLPPALIALVERFDARVFPVGDGRPRVRLTGAGIGSWDVVLHEATATLEPADPARRADALIEADGETWLRLSRDPWGGMDAYRAGRLAYATTSTSASGSSLRRSGTTAEDRLRFERVDTAVGGSR